MAVSEHKAKCLAKYTQRTMKNKTYHLFLFISLLSLGACRKPVTPYEHPDFAPTPTLNAILTKGQAVWAKVSMAQDLASVHPSPCANADVLLFVDDQFAEQLSYDAERELYTGQTVALAGHRYAYKVAITGYDTLFAQTQMPEKPTVTHFEIMENATIDENGSLCPAFLISFKNDPEQRLYFSSNIYARFINRYYDIYTHQSNGYVVHGGTLYTSINTDDPVLLNEGSDRLLFSNEIINDTSYTLKVNTRFGGTGWIGQIDGILERTGEVVVRMHGLSESAYHYMKSQNGHEELPSSHHSPTKFGSEASPRDSTLKIRERSVIPQRDGA